MAKKIKQVFCEDRDLLESGSLRLKSGDFFQVNSQYDSIRMTDWEYGDDLSSILRIDGRLTDALRWLI